MIGITAFAGKPVMSILTIEGKKPNASIENGINISVIPVGSPDDDRTEYIIKNSVPGKYITGGLTCKSKIKELPDFVSWHESGSITSEILVDAIKNLDFLKFFPRDEQVNTI